MPRPPVVVHLDELEALPGPGSLTWHPVRARLGLRAFGTNAYSAQTVGDDVVEPHTESAEYGHEELYFVARGRAREILEDGMRQHPESPSLLIELARLEVRAGREERARELLRQAFERQAESQELVIADPQLAALLG